MAVGMIREGGILHLYAKWTQQFVDVVAVFVLLGLAHYDQTAAGVHKLLDSVDFFCCKYW